MKALVIALGLFSISTYSANCIKATGVTSTANDPFYKERVAMTGKYKGECFDNGMRRNSPRFMANNVVHKDLIQSLYNYEMKPGKVYLGNFRHKGQYYLAEYTPGSIKRTLMMFEKFIEPVNNVVLTGHTHLRFLLDTPINLYHPTKGLVAEVTDFNYAMFAVKPQSIKKQSFSPFGDGIRDNYAVTHNFMSTTAMAMEYSDYATVEATRVAQYELDSFGLNFERTLMGLIDNSHKAYHAKSLAVYHTLRDNCVSNMFVGIVQGDKGKRRAHEDYSGGEIGPGGAKFYTLRTKKRKMVKNPLWVLRVLTKRGMIASRKENQREDFNSDLCNFVSTDGC